uniref:Uncharacterized protein n=1 Tax=Neisseria meningitidis alpha153 TaxID=663926 RepID=C6SA09_NEIME|nr:hypothetical protein predicted by Glimmer/Critica [Neisseria meningitidis alpha153]
MIYKNNFLLNKNSIIKLDLKNLFLIKDFKNA